LLHKPYALLEHQSLSSLKDLPVSGCEWAKWENKRLCDRRCSL